MGMLASVELAVATHAMVVHHFPTSGSIVVELGLRGPILSTLLCVPTQVTCSAFHLHSLLSVVFVK